MGSRAYCKDPMVFGRYPWEVAESLCGQDVCCKLNIKAGASTTGKIKMHQLPISNRWNTGNSVFPSALEFLWQKARLPSVTSGESWRWRKGGETISTLSGFGGGETVN